jgi:hypothetical protein
LNLWAGIREDAKLYFKKNSISWWDGTVDDPTGHLLSSQVACLNHLYSVRQRKEIATALLKYVLPDIAEAVIVDTGFVEFEYIGSKRYLKEKAFTRGANCTSLDAVMLGTTGSGQKVMFLIEWKYTETYTSQNRYIPERAKVYDDLIRASDGPFAAGTDPCIFYYEPFYQMMRQALLGRLFVQNRELGCDRCVNIHVIPHDNLELKTQITSPGLCGENINDAWKRILRDPDSYVTLDPAAFLESAGRLVDTQAWLSYLKARYW